MSPRPRPRPQPATTTATRTGDRAPVAPNTSARRRGIDRNQNQETQQTQQHVRAAAITTTNRVPSWGAPGTLMHDISLKANSHRAAVAEAVRLDKLEREERERLRTQQQQQYQQQQYQPRQHHDSRQFRGVANDEVVEEGPGSALRKLWRCVKGKYGPASWREEERRRKWMEKGKGVVVVEGDGDQNGEGEFVDVWEEKWLFDNRDVC